MDASTIVISLSAGAIAGMAAEGVSYLARRRYGDDHTDPRRRFFLVLGVVGAVFWSFVAIAILSGLVRPTAFEFFVAGLYGSMLVSAIARRAMRHPELPFRRTRPSDR